LSLVTTSLSVIACGLVFAARMAACFSCEPFFLLTFSSVAAIISFVNIYCSQRTRFGEVASVSQRDEGRFARHDTLDSDAGNLPQAKAGLPGRSIQTAVVCCLCTSFLAALNFIG
jgi:hypothetical protein